MQRTEGEADGSRNSLHSRILAEWIAAKGEDQARQRAHALGMRQALRDMDRARAERHARQLLDLGSSRPEVRDRLMAGHGLSRRAAYRAIDAALSQRGRCSGTQRADPGGCENSQWEQPHGDHEKPDGAGQGAARRP